MSQFWRTYNQVIHPNFGWAIQQSSFVFLKMNFGIKY
jgi:hypothetical protein